MSDRIKVLFIEDHEIDQLAFEKYIAEESLPYDYLVVNSVNEAKSTITGNNFDVIVANYMLNDGTILDLYKLR